MPRGDRERQNPSSRGLGGKPESRATLPRFVREEKTTGVWLSQGADRGDLERSDRLGQRNGRYARSLLVAQWRFQDDRGSEIKKIDFV